MSLPPHFSVDGGELKISGVKLMDLVQKYGTPLYVISADRVREKYERLLSATKKHWKSVLICYAYKANPTLALLKVLRDVGAGAEVVSSGELFAAKLVGVDPEKIVFNGVSKSPFEIEDAVSSHVKLINVENIGELDLIDEASRKFGIKASIGVRVNLDVPAETHKYISTGMKIHKFGLDVKNAYNAYKLALEKSNIEVKGIHMHIGSQILNSKPFIKAAEKLVDFSRKLSEKLGLKLSLIDLGGGLGIPYKESDKVLTPEDYCESVFPVIINAIGHVFSEDSTIILEPGRYLVGDAGVLLTRINYVKELGGIKWVLVDAGMNDLIRPALYGAVHRIIPIDKVEFEYAEKCNIAGPICESSDVFAEKYLLPEVKPGDVLAILDAGAYGISMSSQYNCRPRAAVVMIDEGSIKLVRRRETYEDIFLCDIIGKNNSKLS
ncbi:MAG: diaminopimelate decarboxylase [Candidatus Methanomethylicota archaeon]|uniref:Diaminopimelate decarboxylase n=1 Tax=Thermoproteota archaeon TaxID=2056631 RepID=A0A497F1L6_9CREN|nr:MAG: diaminopimelate decarboxylase [Candidatus Verstraetearchaeota archaeon]